MEQQSRSTAHKLQSCDDQPPPPASLDKQQQPLERTKTLSAAESEKVTQILQACRDNDIDELVTLATSRYGFVEDVVRRIACTVHPSRTQINRNRMLIVALQGRSYLGRVPTSLTTLLKSKSHGAICHLTKRKSR